MPLTIPPQFRAEADAFPPDLRALLEAELAAGNTIAQVGHSFPAPPVGAFFRMTKPVSTRPRESGGGLQFRGCDPNRDFASFTDARGFFFILEPSQPPPPQPSMEEIRAALAPKPFMPEPPGPSSTWSGPRPPLLPPSQEYDMDAIRAAHAPKPFPPPAETYEPYRPAPKPVELWSITSDPHTALGKFERSMVMDYEKWHDGTGYDLDVLREATEADRDAIQTMLLRRGIGEWRDVEALAALGTPVANQALRVAMRHRNPEIRLAVVDYAPQLVPETERTASLVRALETAKIWGGFTQALDQAAEFHPAEVVDALLRGALRREGETAVHFAAMVMFVHGKAESPFDWDQRPFFLRFRTADRTEREAAFLELCGKIGVDSSDYL